MTASITNTSDITVGQGRKAMTYMGREVRSVTYVR